MPKIDDPLHDLVELSEGLDGHLDELEAALVAWATAGRGTTLDCRDGVHDACATCDCGCHA